MKKVSYNLNKSWLFGLLALTPVFTACEKDEPVDPKKTEIERLTNLSNQQAKEVRSAVTPALTVPNDNRDWFWAIFNDSRTVNFEKKNLLDSTRTYVVIIDGLYEELGRPLAQDFNPTNLDVLNTKSKNYIATMAGLEKAKTK